MNGLALHARKICVCIDDEDQTLRFSGTCGGRLEPREFGSDKNKGRYKCKLRGRFDLSRSKEGKWGRYLEELTLHMYVLTRQVNVPDQPR